MIDKQELCEKIITLYPDIGECGIDVNVEFKGSMVKASGIRH